MLVANTNQVYTDLSSFTALTNLLSKGIKGIRPLVAEANDGTEFITYSIQFDGYLTKGNSTGFQLQVQSWASTYNKSLAIADQVENAIGASNKYYEYVSAKPHFNEQGEIYTQQIFNIKI